MLRADPNSTDEDFEQDVHDQVAVVPQILAHTATTIDGLAVQVRACISGCEELWIEHEGYEVGLGALDTERPFIEAVARYVGVEHPKHEVVPASPALPNADRSTPDPIFAAIEAHRQSIDEFNRASIRYFDAEEHFADEFGHCTPDAIPKKLREEWATIDPAFLKARCETHADVTRFKTLKDFPQEAIGVFHRELNRQTQIFNQRVEPLRLANDAASDAHNEIEAVLINTTPTTLAGLAALAAYLRDQKDGPDSLLFEEKYLNEFLDLVAKCAAAFA